MKRKLILFMLLSVALGYRAFSQDSPPCSNDCYWEAAPGETLKVTYIPPLPKLISLSFQPVAGATSPSASVYASFSDLKDRNVAVFQVPLLSTGAYTVTATSDHNTSQLGSLLVMDPVKVTGIVPMRNYPGPEGRVYDFTIVGLNFSLTPENNVLEVKGEQYIPLGKKCPEPGANVPASSASTIAPPCLEAPFTHIALVVKGFHPRHFFGPTQFVVHVGSYASDPPVSVNFSYASQQVVAVAAAAIFFGLAFLFISLVRRGIGIYSINGQKFGVMTSLFLDRETNSYSLSKFQVIAWTAVVVYSYVYLFLCRTLVQGNYGAFPGVAQNIPQLFFVSAGTTVAAAAITANYGSKGAGPVKPTPADFISTGGFVAGDRFQFFIWTIVGCIGYVYLVVRSDPFQLTDLPSLPDNFLYLMGVSSAGYLGGKIVRKPGPVIKTLSVGAIIPRVEAQPNAVPPVPARPASMPITLNGENLDASGTIKVDDANLRASVFTIDGQRDPQSQFCSQLTVTLLDADKYIEGTHTLTLVNRDGQAASVCFPKDPLTIDPIPALVAGDQPVPVPISGKNFADGMTARWSRIPDNPGIVVNITNRTDTELTVTLTPGNPGTGKLTLISAIGLSATQDVIVKAAH